MVRTIEYLSLLALAYVDFKESDAGLTLDDNIKAWLDDIRPQITQPFSITVISWYNFKNE